MIGTVQVPSAVFDMALSGLYQHGNAFPLFEK